MAVNKRIKLQIERKGFIDLFEDINIPITKLLSDIRDLSKRSGGYSTSIEVPGTKNNLQLFGHLYDINITNSTFSLKKKYKCVVIKDDIQIFEGYIRMEGINRYEGPDGGSIITFNVSLHDDVSNFFMKIKDKYINPTENIDITNNIFWDDLVIPKYNYSGITSTFENTIEDKFKFFLPYQNRGYYQTSDFKPAIFAYEYVNRIVSSAGYTWNGSKDSTGNFIDQEKWDLLNYYTNFDKLVIPYAGNSDITKPLKTLLYEGYNSIKYNLTGTTYQYLTGTTASTITITGGTSLNVQDLLELYSGNTKLGYVEIYNIISTGSSINQYTVKITDNNGILQQSQDSISQNVINGNINVYFPSKFWLTRSDINFDQYYNSFIKLNFNSNKNVYFDTYSISNNTGTTYYHNTIYQQIFSGGTPTGNTTQWLNYVGTSNINYNYTTIIIKENGTINCNIDAYIDYYMYAEDDCWYCANVGNLTEKRYFGANLNIYKNGILMDSYTNKIIDDLILTPTTAYTDTNSFILNKGVNKVLDSRKFQFAVSMAVNKGDIIYFEVNPQNKSIANNDINNNSYFRKIGSIYTPPNYFVGFTDVYEIAHLNNKNDTTIKITLTGNVEEDDENLTLTNFIPKKIKQSDLLLGLCRLFNLYIDYDEQKKSLLILPRDQYYILGKKVDWNNKLDVSNKNNFIFYPDLKYKNYIYTYKLDNDDYSKAYNDNVKEIYGQVNIKFENDLLDGTTTIDSIFYSTPIARAGGNVNIYDGSCENPTNNSGSLIIPKQDGNLISIIDYSKTTNLKLLYDCGLQSDPKSTPFLFRIKSAEPLPTGYTYEYTCSIPKDDTTSSPAYNVGWIKYNNKDKRGYYLYPHIGHFYNGPMQPNDDLNYAQCDYYFYNDINIFTENNLFYKHWLRTIRQQRDCKLLKARIHLSPAEVNSIKFNNSYYLFDTWWVLNKFEYNEDGSDLYNVELINII